MWCVDFCGKTIIYASATFDLAAAMRKLVVTGTPGNHPHLDIAFQDTRSTRRSTNAAPGPINCHYIALKDAVLIEQRSRDRTRVSRLTKGRGRKFCSATIVISINNVLRRTPDRARKQHKTSRRIGLGPMRKII